MKIVNPVTIIIVSVIILGGTMALLSHRKSNRSIESIAKKTFVFKNYLKDDAIKIDVANNGVVTLTGTVSKWTHRSLAEETVANLDGVKIVSNKLEVIGGQPIENSDVWINMKVATTLMFHSKVSLLKTDIDVLNGKVTLRGEASSEAQKELATEYVMDVDGVKGVENDMIVEGAKKTTTKKVGDYVDDASITAQVKLALLFHHSTNFIKTKVETKDGIVTVSGMAKNSAEKDLVGKLVNNIVGVKSLRNNITIS